MTQLTGQGTLSLQKGKIIDSTENMEDYGYRRITFAHQMSSTGGEDHIPLDALVYPTGQQAFIADNPSADFMLKLQLREFSDNLTLFSTSRGILIPKISFWCSNTKIHLRGFVAQPNETFYGVVQNITRPNTMFVDAVPINVSRTLPLGQTTFNVGEPFHVNAFENESTGAVKVYVDRQLQYRNTNNSDSVLDRDYYEVPNSEGLGVSIEFNTPFGSNVEVTVVSNYAYVDRPNFSLLNRIDILAAQIESLATQTSSTLDLTAFPNTMDIKAFGDRLLNAEQGLQSDGKVGDVVSSFLTEAQFQTERDNSWILADGRSIVGTSLASLTGWTNAPDLRGAFLRGKDHGVGRNPDGDTALGTYQEDSLQGFRIQVDDARQGDDGTGGGGLQAGDSGSPHIFGQTIVSDGVNGTPRISSETRSKNVTANFFIKVN
jgi:hypothetical protein